MERGRIYPEQREGDFKAAYYYAKKDEIFSAGVEVAPIIELRIRKSMQLERAKRDSPNWKYVKGTTHDKYLKQEDLAICNGCLYSLLLIPRCAYAYPTEPARYK